MKKNLHLFFPATCFLMILTVSCKKDHTEPPPPVTATFSMKDTLIIESQYATQFPEIYNKYNGKSYTVNSENLKFDLFKANNKDVVFHFEDFSSGILVPSFTIQIKNTDFSSLMPEYNLTDTAHLRTDCSQQFTETSVGYLKDAQSGVLKINYDSKYKTVSGEISNLKIPIDFYVPDDPQPNRVLPRVLILNGGSTRTVSLKFDFVRI